MLNIIYWRVQVLYSSQELKNIDFEHESAKQKSFIWPKLLQSADLCEW